MTSDPGELDPDPDPAATYHLSYSSRDARTSERGTSYRKLYN